MEVEKLWPALHAENEDFEVLSRGLNADFEAIGCGRSQWLTL
jgi:hypothetical protein